MSFISSSIQSLRNTFTRDAVVKAAKNTVPVHPQEATVIVIGATAAMTIKAAAIPAAVTGISAVGPILLTGVAAVGAYMLGRGMIVTYLEDC